METPAEADQLFNPLLNMLDAEAKGKAVYIVLPGLSRRKGDGDGAAGAGRDQKASQLPRRTGNQTKGRCAFLENLKWQRQYAPVWKIINGRTTLATCILRTLFLTQAGYK